MFCGVHRKTPVLESLYNKVAGLQDGNFNKKRLLAGVFLWNLLIGWSVNYTLTMWSYQWRHTLSFHPGPSLAQVLISCLIWHGFLPESCKAVIFWTNSGEDVQRPCKFVWGGGGGVNKPKLSGVGGNLMVWFEDILTFLVISLSSSPLLSPTFFIVRSCAFDFYRIHRKCRESLRWNSFPD